MPRAQHGVADSLTWPRGTTAVLRPEMVELLGCKPHAGVQDSLQHVFLWPSEALELARAIFKAYPQETA